MKLYYPIIKKLILLICAFFILTQCAVYRTRAFKPAMKIESFEGWNIVIDFSAYESSRVDPSIHHDYGFYLCSTTFKKGWGTRPGSYKDSRYEAVIKSIRLFYDGNNENEITIKGWNKYSFPGEKACWSIDKSSSIYIPPHINKITINAEIEYLLDNKSVIKKYLIPMKRHETSVPFIEMK